MSDIQSQLNDYKDRYDRLKDKISQSDRIKMECMLFLIKCMIDRQQDNMNTHQEVKTSENKGSDGRAPDIGGSAGIGGHKED